MSENYLSKYLSISLVFYVFSLLALYKSFQDPIHSVGSTDTNASGLNNGHSRRPCNRSMFISAAKLDE